MGSDPGPIPHPDDMREPGVDYKKTLLLYHQAKQLERIADSLEEMERLGGDF